MIQKFAHVRLHLIKHSRNGFCEVQAKKQGQNLNPVTMKPVYPDTPILYKATEKLGQVLKGVSTFSS